MPPDGIVFRWIILVLAIFAVNYFEFQSVVKRRCLKFLIYVHKRKWPHPLAAMFFDG